MLLQLKKYNLKKLYFKTMAIIRCKNPLCRTFISTGSKSGYCRICVRRNKETTEREFKEKLKRKDGINSGKTYAEYVEEGKTHWEYVKKYSFGNLGLK